MAVVTDITDRKRAEEELRKSEQLLREKTEFLQLTEVITRAANEATRVDEAVQILGGRGVLASHPVDRLYRAVRALRIYEGTTEIQRIIIARALIAERAERP